MSDDPTFENAVLQFCKDECKKALAENDEIVNEYEKHIEKCQKSVVETYGGKQNCEFDG